jgi:hypothetical protein
MGQATTYCSDCYNKVARAQDAQIKAAESDGKVPMTKEGTCWSCRKATIVIYFEG